MNKLVSKNPVLRFKLGRKIDLFQEGGISKKRAAPIKRFVLASSDNSFTKEFDTEEEAKAYRKAHKIVGVIRDQKGASRGSVIKSSRVSGKDAKTTAYDRQLAEKYNHLSRAQAYREAQKTGNKFFAYKGKVYKTDLKNGKNNMDEMISMYGNNLGWDKDPKLQTTTSRTAREQYRSLSNAKSDNRRASYQGKTNKQVSEEADRRVAQSWPQDHQVSFVDAMFPTTAIGNAFSAAASGMMGEEYHPQIYASGFNPLGYGKTFTRVLDGDVSGGLTEGLVRGVDAYATLGMPGVSGIVDRTMTSFAPRLAPISSTSKYIPEGGLRNGTLNKWNWNSLAKGGNKAIQSSWNKGVKTVTEGGRRSMQRAANEGFLFTGFRGSDKATQWATNFGLNPNTGTAFFFRGAPTAYDVAADKAVQVAPWLGVPVDITTQQVYNNL